MMKMDNIVQVLKDCNHGMPKFLCRRCSPRSAPKREGYDRSWGNVKKVTVPTEKRSVARYRPKTENLE